MQSNPSWLARILLQRANDAQWQKARDTKRPEDFDKAREGRKAITVFDLLRNITQLGR